MEIPVLQSIDTVYIIWNEKKYLFFGGYDYHRLSRHQRVETAAKNTIDRYGLNCGGSRVTTGNHPLHVQLELSLSEFLGMEGCVLLPTGYMANLALFEVLATKDLVCYYHPQCHPSLKAAMKMSGLPAFTIPESISGLDTLIARQAKKPLIITDGVYSDLPPLPAYHELVKKYDGALLIDEAHALGILGDHGRGASEHFHLSTDHLLLTGSLSKALGAAGGFVSGLTQCIEAVRETRTYATTSALSLPLAAAGIASLDYLRDNSILIRNFQQRCLQTKQQLINAGYNIPLIPSPVISIFISDTDRINALKHALINAEIYPSFIHYPEKPGYFRFALSSAHSEVDISCLLEVLRNFRKTL